MKTRAFLAQSVLVILAVAMLVPYASAFSVPESLIYDVSWKGIKAGTAVLEVTATAQGDELLIVNTIRSLRLLSAFFPVDDKRESVISRAATQLARPMYFRETINEGKHHYRKEARFNLANLTVDSRDLLNNIVKTDPISASTYDSLSSIYFLRSRQLVPGQSISFHIYDFKRLWNTDVRVERREDVRTPLGKFKTLMMTSRLTFNGISAGVGNTTFWLTDDSRRIPVRIRTQLKVGEITLTLVKGSYWP